MEPIAANRAEMARRRHIERNQERSARTGETFRMLFWTVLFCFAIAASPVVQILAGGKAGQPVYRILIYLIGLFSFAFAMIRKRREILSLLSKNLLLNIFLILQIFFAFFAISVKDAFTQIFIFTTSALLVSSTRSLFPGERFLQIIVGLCVFILFGSMATALGWKAIGLQPNGAWQGMFGSKNDLGHCAALATGIVILAGPTYLRNWVFWAATVLVGLMCIVCAKSGGAVVILVGMLAGVQFLRIKSVPLKIIGFLFVSCVGIIFSVYSSEFIHAALTSLGKDETLTGRAHIWGFAMPLIAEHWMIGAGYGWTGYSETIAYFEGAIGVPHLHNAYLSAMINSGALGTGLFFVSYLMAGLYAISVKPPPSGELSRLVFWGVLVGWYLSGFSEPGIIDSYGPKCLFGLSAAFGLYGLERAQAQTIRRKAPQRASNAQA